MLAAMLRDFGVDKGDRVILYMPMVPEAVIGMLACARIGAVHSVVFGGFAARSSRPASTTAKPKVDPLARAAGSSPAASSIQAAARRGDRARRAQAAMRA